MLLLPEMPLKIQYVHCPGLLNIIEKRITLFMFQLTIYYCRRFSTKASHLVGKISKIAVFGIMIIKSGMISKTISILNREIRKYSAENSYG